MTGGSSSQKGSAQPQRPEDDWASIKDPNERRKIQNKLAQRKFREKTKQEKEEAARAAQNRKHAGAAYTSPDPESLDPADNLTGLPWGSLPLRQAISAGKEKERTSQGPSETSSKEGSVKNQSTSK